MIMALALATIHPEEQLLFLHQNGCPLEDYLEEFLEFSHQVTWNESILKVYVWGGLDESPSLY